LEGRSLIAAVSEELEQERDAIAQLLREARALARAALDEQLQANRAAHQAREDARIAGAEADARQRQYERDLAAADRAVMEAEQYLAEAKAELEAAKLAEGSSHPGMRPHEIMYVCPNGETMTAPMAFMSMVCLVLTVKWGYPTPAQLHDLGSITKGKPKFPGEESLVSPSEDYEAYLARTAGYTHMCALVGREVDISDAVLQGLGKSQLDRQVRQAVQFHLLPLAAKHRTPQLIAELIRKAVRQMGSSIEAERQERLEAEAEKLGLGAATFG